MNGNGAAARSADPSNGVESAAGESHRVRQRSEWDRIAASVRIHPGHTAFTRMPRGASSQASERVSPITACLLAT